MKVFALDLWQDLREKRLWPVALLLLAALVAVPVLLAKPAVDGRLADLRLPGRVLDRRPAGQGHDQRGIGVFPFTACHGAPFHARRPRPASPHRTPPGAPA